MKNHIIFKFIAVLLCAASLLGAVGSGLGIFLMTEMDLYDKSVDQVHAERVEANGRELAQKVGMHYASTVLGGTPEVMVEEYFGYGDMLSSSGFDPFYVGYELKDGEGTVLTSRELNYGTSFTTYSFDVTGQYMHFVDQIAPSEETTPETEPQMYLDAAYDVLVDEIPPQGATVSEVQISTYASSSGASGGELGTVFRNQEGLVVLRCPGFDIGPVENPVTAIALYDSQGKLIYEASAEDGVGRISYAEDGTRDLVFVSFYPYVTDSPVPVAETIPETTAAETVPETTAAAETIPVTTAPEETISEETTAETTEAIAETTAPAAVEAAAPANTVSLQLLSAVTVPEQAVQETAASTETTAEAAPETVPEATEATETTEAPTEPETLPEETAPAETVALEPVPERTMINGKPLESYQVNRTEYYDTSTDEWITVRYVYLTMPEMTLELYVAPGALRSESSFTLMRVVVGVSRYLFPVMGVSLLLFAITLVYLFCAAAKRPGTAELRPGGLNRLPLDLYGFLITAGVSCCCLMIAEGPGAYLLQRNVTVGCAFMAAMGYLAALQMVGFLFACAAQFRTPGGFWWRNSLVGWCLKLLKWTFAKFQIFCAWLQNWLEIKGIPMFTRLCKWIWRIVCKVWFWFWNGLNRCYRWLYGGFSHFYDLLPMIWQWILTGSAMVLFLFITVAGRYDFGIVLAVLFAFALVIYGAHCFGSLMETTRKMNRGDLNAKAEDKRMIGAFKDFAHDLNDLADVAVVAAQKQLKSERMKTELITNVSHDIRTPLTSIINYVDLLQKAHTEEEQEQYLEVLDRQSQRLKKLIDDLIDMSKASTGNMAVDITRVDAVESVNQALGEFGDKLDRAYLTPVFRHTEDSVAMMADGKLVWRVLSNLLSNAVKYAMPGTRLYIDLMRVDNTVVISLKNISRDELNVDAEELMERFVRGDDARNTEGSGLGLNIAKSLMELQKGQLQLLVDGDLFKVTLIFPGV